MRGSMRTNCRRELEEAMLPSRLARKRKGKAKSGWLRGIREAVGLGCELVYALVPKEGKLEEMALEHDGVRKQALAKKRAERDEGKEAYLAAMQTRLRREGYRVRPRKTDRGDEQKMADFEMNVRVMKLAGMLGPFMREFLREQAEEQASSEGSKEEG